MTVNSLLVEVATKNLKRLLKRGHDYDAASQFVTEEFGLSPEEKDKVDELIKEDDVEVKSEDETYDAPTEIPTSEYVIYFKTSDDLDDAIGRLMYNRVSWVSQGEYEDCFRIEFSDIKTIQRAIKVLNKYDFISDKFEPVASISFDNFDEFQKVLSFIKKNDMFVTDVDTDGSLNPEEITQTEFKASNRKDATPTGTRVGVLKTF